MLIQKSNNWSLLDRSNLYHMLNLIRKDIVNKKLPVDQIHSLLSTHIKQHLSIRIVRDKSVHTMNGYVYIGGAYYSDYDQANKRAFEVVFSYNPTDTHLLITSHRWKRMCILFADTMLHEIIHMRQYRSRNFKDIYGYESTAYSAKQRKSQEYYGKSDEIGAFAFNIACEMLDKYKTEANILEYLASTNPRKRRYSCYFKYLEAFDFNHNHHIICKLKKKVIYYLPYAKLGKPFKTTNHLTH